MPTKKHPLGVCDLCNGPISPGDWYTSKRRPRLYCSIDCRNTANSRNGNPERVRKLRIAVAAGAWQNPAHLRPPTSAEQSDRSRQGRLREVAEGRWRNPGLTPEARAINSLPHKHSGPLAAAIEKLKVCRRLADLTDDEHAAYLAYSRALRAARRDEVNAGYRRRYAERRAAMTEAEREAQRAKWRADNQRRKRTSVN